MALWHSKTRPIAASFLALAMATLYLPALQDAYAETEHPSPATEPGSTTTSVSAEQTIAEQMAAKERMAAKIRMTKPALPGSDIHNLKSCNPNGIALSGVDVVSYHKPTGPLIGNVEFSVQHNNFTWHFLSAAHAAEFSANPDAYLPQYMGWCATSLAVGALTCPNPLNYKIENGQLLLFETTGFTNGQHLWNSDPLDFRRRADRNRDAFLQSARS